MASFRVVRQPTTQHYQALSELDPGNPFLTEAYATARAACGAKPSIFQLYEGTRLLGGCVGFNQGGALSRTLEVPSAPHLPEDFWRELERHCRAEHVWELRVESFGSAPFDMPALATPLGQRQRTEYVVELADGDLRSKLSTNHRRNLQRAENNGLRICRSIEPAMAELHTQLMDASSQRREKRGEDVAQGNAERFVAAALASGCGELFYATHADEVLSSLFVLRSSKGTYYHSAGTSPVGMKLGASVLVVSHALRARQEEGATTFNLGGADPGAEGLRRFKTGFGARPVELSAATFGTMPALLRKARTFAKDLRDDPKSLLPRVCTIEQYAVYRACPRAIAEGSFADEQRTLKRLSDDQLLALETDAQFADQARRFRMLGYNAAYGLFEADALVHIAWLITPELDRRTPVRNVRLRPGEMEITHCETHSEHRGRGLYPAAISRLCQVAANAGAQTVFMITATTNEGSQKGIERAGFVPCARVLRFIMPALPGAPAITFRGHRWRHI